MITLIRNKRGKYAVRSYNETQRVGYLRVMNQAVTNGTPQYNHWQMEDSPYWDEERVWVERGIAEDEFESLTQYEIVRQQTPNP